jgi:hypothetical protein
MKMDPTIYNLPYFYCCSCARNATSLLTVILETLLAVNFDMTVYVGTGLTSAKTSIPDLSRAIT